MRSRGVTKLESGGLASRRVLLGRSAAVWVVVLICGAEASGQPGRPSRGAPVLAATASPGATLAASAPTREARASRRKGFGGKFQKIVQRVLGYFTRMSSCGLRVIDVPTGRVLAEEFVNPRRIVFPASSIKTLLAVAALRRLDQIRATPLESLTSPIARQLKKATLAEQLDVALRIYQPHADVECLRVRERELKCKRRHGRIVGPYAPGARRKVRRFFEDMIWVGSDNIAASMLFDIAVNRGGPIDKRWIRETADRMSHPDPSTLRVMRRFHTYKPGGGAIGRGENTATALDYVRLYQEIVTGQRRVLSEESRAFLIDQLRRQTTESKLNHWFRKEATFYHKSGHSVTAISDAGFFYLGKQMAVILVVLAEIDDKESMQEIGGHTFRFIESHYNDIARP